MDNFRSKCPRSAEESRYGPAVHKQVLAALTLVIGLSLAFSGASCVTCPAGQQSCGNANASGDAGSSGDDDQCALLTAMKTCMDAFCKTASNPYCTCYKLGKDLTT